MAAEFSWVVEESDRNFTDEEVCGFRVETGRVIEGGRTPFRSDHRRWSEQTSDADLVTFGLS